MEERPMAPADTGETASTGSHETHPRAPEFPQPAEIFSVAGKVAVVTGASSGLGARFAGVLAAAGASVVLAARRVQRIEALAGALPRAVAVPCDVALPGDRERLVARALDTYGRIDILVNNAGITVTAPIEHETLEDFQAVVDVNLTAVWHLTKLAGVSMVAQGGGSVVNIASILGLVASAPIRQAGYTATKGAVVNLTRELAVQWARRGVRVNAIAPGWFPSEMTESMEGDEGSQRFLRANCPMARMGGVHELDGALLLLASDAGSYLTGQTIVVDGGWTAR